MQAPILEKEKLFLAFFVISASFQQLPSKYRFFQLAQTPPRE